jgi:endonuclease G
MFRGLFGCKRLLPGYLMGYRRYLPQRRADPNPQSLEVLAHDCSTLGGNSGSAVLDITTGDVVGLHFAGEYLTANYAVPAWELAADPRVIDLGVNVIPGPTGHSL